MSFETKSLFFSIVENISFLRLPAFVSASIQSSAFPCVFAIDSIPCLILSWNTSILAPVSLPTIVGFSHRLIRSFDFSTFFTTLVTGFNGGKILPVSISIRTDFGVVAFSKKDSVFVTNHPFFGIVVSTVPTVLLIPFSIACLALPTQYN